MSIQIDPKHNDSNTTTAFIFLMETINAALSDGHLKDLNLFVPAHGDEFVRHSFEKKTNDMIDDVYFLCIEDRSKESRENFLKLDVIMTEYFRFLTKELKIEKMDNMNIAYSGVLEVSTNSAIFYYLSFCLQETVVAAEA